MNRILIAVLAAANAVGPLSLAAQGPGGTPGVQIPVAAGEIRGAVVVAGGAVPIPRASITVKNKAGVVVAGAIAGDNGTFRIQGLRPGTYFVRVTSIGFGPKNTDPFTILPASPVVTLGAIPLTQIAVALQSVQVATDRATVTIEPDRNGYRAKDIAPAAGNAVDVLEAVPSVQVDGEGKISLRGNENVAIQINGRPAPITGAMLTSYLKGLPANIVERIEVIPNPSARYDPEGMAGIINIVLKQNTDLGMSGAVNGGMANSQRYNGSGNLGYQSGPLTVFSSYGLNADNRGVVGINDRERFSSLQSLLSATDQDISEQSGNRGQNIYISSDYKLNSRDLLSNGMTLNLRNGTDGMSTGYSELNGAGTLMDRYNRLRDDAARGSTFDYTLDFKRTYVPRKHELSTEVRFNRARDTDLTDLWKQPLTMAGVLTGSRVEGEIDDTKSLTRQLTGQLDYTRTLADRTKLETGYKGTARWLDRDFLVQTDALGTGAWITSNLSNNFRFDERVHAVYGVLSQGAGKFELQGGLRAERANRDFSLTQPAASYPYAYTSLFPSGVVLYNKSDATQMKLSYSRRIRRPGTQELNPFPSFFDVQNVFIGNPRLNPEYTDAIELGFTHSGQYGSLQLSPFYRYTKNVIRVAINTSDTIQGREVTSVTFQNLANSNSWGTDLNGTLKLGPRFNGLAGFNIFKIVTDGGSTSSLQSNAVAWSYRMNLTSQITQTLTAQGSYFYRGPMNIERGRFSAIQQTGLSLRQKFYGDAAAVSLRVVDPFNTGGFKIKVANDNITQISERNFGVRAAFLTFQYNFGKAPKIRQRPDQPQDTRPGFPSGG